MTSEFICKRPKPGDDDDELLRQQEEFLNSKQQPSVKIINLQRSANISNENSIIHNTPKNARKIESQFSRLKRLASKQSIISTSQADGEIINPVVDDKIQRNLEKKREDAVQNIPIRSSNVILGDVVEKRIDIKNYKVKPNRNRITLGLGFPDVFQSNNTDTDDHQSIFWKEVSTSKHVIDDLSAKIAKHRISEKDTSIPMEVQWAAEIHEENLKKLAQMSETEILETKKTLEETMDVKLIEYLRHGKKRKTSKILTEQQSMQHSISPRHKTEIDINVSSNKKIKFPSNNKDDMAMDCECNTSSLPRDLQEILQEGKEKGWVHMDIPEPDKFKWMEDLSLDTKNETDPNEWYNARFDFNGLLLPYKDEELSMYKGLHHHGEEPERPGYSFQELLQLSRSSTQQQRCIALTTLANIMEKTRNGWYDKTLHPAPLIVLSQKNLLLLLRFSLDDTSVAIVTAALQALRAFLFSEADEVCLDRLYGIDDYVEPTLTPQLEDEDTSNLKDHELAQLDAVAALLRSNILMRISYILRNMRPPPIGVTSALEILIRLVRHSHKTALYITHTMYLLDDIIHYFMPISIDQLAMQDTVNDVYGIPLVKAVKLCRVLVTYCKKPFAIRLHNSRVIQSILTYISSETGRKDDIHLSIESLRLWRILLHYEVALDSVSGARLILVSQLQLLLSNHDIQTASELKCEYAAALIAIASYEKTLQPNMCTLLAKWSTQLVSISKPTWSVMKLIAVTLSAVDDMSAFRTNSLSNPHIFSELLSNSNLLSKLTNCNPAIDREPSCLPNLNVLLENGKLQPSVSLNSCIPFLTKVLIAYCSNLRIVEIQSIFEQRYFCKYIQDLAGVIEWNLERSWYSRTELNFLMTIVKAASILGDKIDNIKAEFVWQITVKLISALSADATEYLNSLLEIAMSKKRINREISKIEFQQNFLFLNIPIDRIKNKIYSCADAVALYKRYLIHDGNWNQAAMPKDWIFLPLVDIYTKSKNDIKLQPEDKDNIHVVLSLVSLLPYFFEQLSPTLRFSRLVLVYLCDNVYLDADVSLLLKSNIKTLLKAYHWRLNFKTELPGLSSFTDLFTTLCEHFCSNSYGDDGFSMILLIPIAQRHDTHYRKLLWSEHAGALRYLKLPVDELMIPLREYLYPEEEDISLIESYITALVRGMIRESWCPVPYAIAVHHSAMYLKRSNNLATRMRRQIEKLQNKDIVSKLLQYEPQIL